MENISHLSMISPSQLWDFLMTLKSDFSTIQAEYKHLNERLAELANLTDKNTNTINEVLKNQEITNRFLSYFSKILLGLISIITPAGIYHIIKLFMGT